MAEQSSNKQHIEQEIAALEAKLAEKRQVLGLPGQGAREVLATKEIIKEAVRERMANAAPPAMAIAPAQTQVTVAPTQVTHDSLIGQSPDRQVTALINVALEQGIDHAVNIAKNLNDPFIYDSLHDSLTTIFYDELIKRNKLQIQ